MRIAQILYEKVHWIFEAEKLPDWPPSPEGNPIVLIDITDKPEIQEGWDHDADSGEFAPPELKPQPPVSLTE